MGLLGRHFDRQGAFGRELGSPIWKHAFLEVCFFFQFGFLFSGVKKK